MEGIRPTLESERFQSFGGIAKARKKEVDRLLKEGDIPRAIESTQLVHGERIFTLLSDNPQQPYTEISRQLDGDGIKISDVRVRAIAHRLKAYGIPIPPHSKT